MWLLERLYFITVSHNYTVVGGLQLTLIPLFFTSLNLIDIGVHFYTYLTCQFATPYRVTRSNSLLSSCQESDARSKHIFQQISYIIF